MKDDIDNPRASKPVNMLDELGNVLVSFPSCTSAARAVGGESGSSISRVCKGICKSAYGHQWSYTYHNSKGEL